MEVLSKGFVFSIDALLAITVIIAVSLSFLLLAQKPDSELYSLQALRIKTNDSTVVQFYAGDQSPYPYSATARTYYCALKYDYPLNTDHTSQSAIGKFEVCEEKG